MKFFFFIAFIFLVTLLVRSKLKQHRGDGRKPADTDNSELGVHYLDVEEAKAVLKEAAQLKRNKDFDAAVEKLNSAYSMEGARLFSVKEHLRLPMYLQLAGKNDEGWALLNQMNVEWVDPFSQAEIAKQMRIFLAKEKKYDRALLLSMWEICKEVERDRKHLAEIGYSRKDVMYSEWKSRIKEYSSIEHIEPRLKRYCKNSDKGLEIPLSKVLSQYIKSEKTYDMAFLRQMIQAHRELESK